MAASYVVTVTPSATQVTDLTEYEFDREGFHAAFTSIEEGEKAGDAFIPAQLALCPVPCRNAYQPTKLNCGGGHGHRLADNVTAMTGFVLDLDKLTGTQLDQLIAGIMAKGVEFWVYTSYSHTPEAPRVRIVIPFNEPMPLPSSEYWSKHAWPQLVAWAGPAAIDADTSCRDPARLYFTPRKPKGSTHHVADYNPGQSLDWRSVVSETAPAELLKPNRPQASPSVGEDPAREVDLFDLKSRLRRSREPVMKQMVARALDTPARPIVDLTDPHRQSRYEAWRDLTNYVSLRAHEWEATEALLFVLRPAHDAEVQQQEDPTPWETVEHLLESARGSAPEVKARKAARDARSINSVMQRMGMRFPQPGQAVNEPGDNPDTTPEPEDPAELPEEDWRHGLEVIRKQNRNGEEGPPKLAVVADNTLKILLNHPNWRGRIKFNTLAVQYELHDSPLYNGVHVIQQTDFTLITHWLTDHLKYRTKTLDVKEQVLAIGQCNSYDPLATYLKSIKHDGTKRVDDWLMTYLGAPTVDAQGTDITEYLRAAGRKWLISAVARGLNPGQKADVAMHLEGDQGAGKSSAVQILGGTWFTDSPINMKGDKDSLMVIGQSWIVELGELSAFSRSEVNQQKLFLAQREDLFRPPYGGQPQRFPRHCVFIGTTNAEEYLTDETGNRRHWPVRCGKIDLEALRRDRDQLWAEAVAMYKAGEVWHMTPEEQLLANGQTDQRMASDSIQERVEDYFLQMRPESRPKRVRLVDILKNVFEGERVSDKQVSRTLVLLGFVKKKEKAGPRYYVVPDRFVDSPRVSGGAISMLRAVPTPTKDTDEPNAPSNTESGAVQPVPQPGHQGRDLPTGVRPPG